MPCRCPSWRISFSTPALDARDRTREREREKQREETDRQTDRQRERLCEADVSTRRQYWTQLYNSFPYAPYEHATHMGTVLAGSQP
jgi:hypothetical protein